MNKIKIYLWAVLALLLVASCSNNREFPGEEIDDGRITLTLQAPDWDASTRAMLSEQEWTLDLMSTFRTEGIRRDKVRLFIQQGDKLFDQGNLDFSEVSEDKRVAKLSFTMPEDVDKSKPVNIIGYNGLNQLNRITIKDGRAVMAAMPSVENNIDDFEAPVVFRLKDVMPTAEALNNQTLRFEHIGCYEIIHLTNNSDQEIKGKVTLALPDSYGEKPWLVGQFYKEKQVVYPLYDIVKGELLESSSIAFQSSAMAPTIAPGETKTVVAWGIPLPQLTSQGMEVMYTGEGFTRHHSAGLIPSKKMEVGRAYHAYAVWDGNKIIAMDPSTNEARQTSYVSVTTEIPAGKRISFKTYVPFQSSRSAWVDLNDNGTKDGDIENAPKNFRKYTPTVDAPKITFHGVYTDISMAEQKITKVEVSPAATITGLDVSENKLSAEALNELFRQLPDITDVKKDPFNTKELKIAGNPGVDDCDVSIATKKGWVPDVIILNRDEENYTIIRKYGTTERLYFEFDVAEGDTDGIWVDLNNNGTKDEGEAITRLRGGIVKVEPLANNMVFYGKISRITLLEGSCFIFLGGRNPYLKHLSLSKCGLAAMIMRPNSTPNIEYLDVSGNDLFVDVLPLDLSGLKNLKVLNLEGCGAFNIDLSQNKELTYLNVESNKLETLDVTIMPKLKQLFASNNSLATLDISKNPQLIHLDVTMNALSTDVLNGLITNLPDRQGKTPGIFYLAGNPGTGSANLTAAKGKNWEVDARNTKADNKVKRPIMVGEDW